jgi:hypothetical protein
VTIWDCGRIATCIMMPTAGLKLPAAHGMREEPKVDRRICHLLNREGLIFVKLICCCVGIFQGGIEADRNAILHQSIFVLMQWKDAWKQLTKGFVIFVNLLSRDLIAHVITR